jgi:hypothetical protein
MPGHGGVGTRRRAERARTPLWTRGRRMLAMPDHSVSGQPPPAGSEPSTVWVACDGPLVGRGTGVERRSQRARHAG